MSAKLFSELKLVTDNLLSIYEIRIMYGSFKSKHVSTVKYVVHIETLHFLGYSYYHRFRL